MKKNIFYRPGGDSPVVRQGPSDGQILDAMENDSVARGPMVTVNDALETGDLLTATAHVRRKNETILALIARTGISPLQIRVWPRQRIADFVQLQELQAEEGDGAFFKIA